MRKLFLALFIFLLVIPSVFALVEKVTKEQARPIEFQTVKVKVTDASGNIITTAIITTTSRTGEKRFTYGHLPEPEYYYVSGFADGFDMKVCAKGYASQQLSFTELPTEPVLVSLSSEVKPSKTIEGYVYEKPEDSRYPSYMPYQVEKVGTPLAGVPLVVMEDVGCEQMIDTQKIESDAAGHFSAQVIGDAQICINQTDRKYDYACARYSFGEAEKWVLYTKKRYFISIDIESGYRENMKSVVSCSDGSVTASNSLYEIEVPKGAGSCNILVYDMFRAGTSSISAVGWGENKITLKLDKKTTDIQDQIPSLTKESIKIEKGWNLIPSMIDHEYGTCPLDLNYVFVFDPVNQKYIRASEAESLGEDLEEIIKFSSVWFYSTIACETPITKEYDDGASTVVANNIKPKAGWNLIFATSDMIGNPLKKMAGTCSEMKLYSWDASNQKWASIGSDVSFGIPYMGLALKVGSDCEFELGPKPLESVPGFEYLSKDESTSDGIRTIRVSYSRDQIRYKVQFAAMSLEKLEELVAQPSAPKFSLETLKVNENSYDVYYGVNSGINYMWYHSGWLIMVGPDNYRNYDKSAFVELAKAYLERWPPTQTLDFIELLPIAPELPETTEAETAKAETIKVVSPLEVIG